MTRLPDPPIRRHDDGAIDIRFYGRRANALRQSAIEDFGKRQVQALRAAAWACGRFAALSLPRT